VAKSKASRPERRIAFRFMRQEGSSLHSVQGNLLWPLPVAGKPGKWVLHVDPMRLCRAGLHASTTPYHALANRQGYVFAQVECEGKFTETEEGKFACSKVRIVRVYDRKYLVALAALGAALALHHFEAQRPGDTRPRLALELVLRWLRGEVPAGLRSAASAAWAARNECRASASAAAYADAASAAYAAAAYAADASAAAANAAASAAAAYAAAYAYAADAAAAAYAADAAAAAYASAYAAAYADDAAADAAAASAYAANAASAAGAAARRQFIEEFDELAIELLETPLAQLAHRVELVIPVAPKVSEVAR